MTLEQEQIYYRYLERLRLKFIKKYDELGLRASGAFEQKLEPEVTKSSMIMYGAPHTQFMEKGRGTGPEDYRKLAPFMEQWIEVKQGLPAVFYEKKKSMAFAIAHKIATEGITVPNEYNQGKLVEDVVNDFLANDIYDMLQELGEIFLSRIKVDLIEILEENLTAA